MPNLYLDMDGCIAKWNAAANEKDLYAPGYFYNLEPEINLIEAIKALAKNNVNIVILTAYLTECDAKNDKKRWLEKQGLDDVPVVFVPYGISKAECLKRNLTNEDYLLDDYSKNLHDWEKHGGTPVKFFNGINGTKGTFKGLSVDFRNPEKLKGMLV